MDLIRKLVEKRFKKAPMAEFRPGDTVKVHVKIAEGEKVRVQVFEGMVIMLKKGGLDSSFTVRKMSNGVGVERTFPFYSSAIDRVEVLSRGNTRRSRLFYLRNLEGKAARVDSELESSAAGQQVAGN
ncbi:MAG: 50S ribosomal protein L19 [Oligoflexia bacterium]|nr:50S ribosomal protein L19 [Oligoflexia bacterium]